MKSSNRLKQVKAFLKAKQVPLNMSPSEIQTLKRLASKFFLRDDNMYYSDKKGGHQLVIFTKAMKDAVLKECHDDPATGGHQGLRRTQNKVKQNYYWMEVTKDVENWVKRCMLCQKAETIKTQAQVLHPITTETPWEMVGVDLIGPFPETEQSNRYACTMTDLFTKWTIATPIPNKSAPSVAKVLMDTIYRYGPPKQFLTDQGREFVNKLNTEIMDLFGIKQAVTSAYHPQTNGQDERTNRTIKQSLAKYINSDQNDWDKYLLPISYAINTSKQASTKFTPFYLMYGRNPHAPTSLNAATDDEVMEFLPSLTPTDITDRRISEMADVQGKKSITILQTN